MIDCEHHSLGAAEIKSSGLRVRVTCGDITELDVDGFVFYIGPNLKLGTGFGGAIAKRGGTVIQKELDAFETRRVGEAVITSAGKLRAGFIVHAVGPAFQEEAIEEKLKVAVSSALRAADERGAARIAFPAMGTGLYGIPVEVSARVMGEAIGAFARQARSLKEIIICVKDPWIAPPYEEVFAN